MKSSKGIKNGGGNHFADSIFERRECEILRLDGGGWKGEKKKEQKSIDR